MFSRSGFTTLAVATAIGLGLAATASANTLFIFSSGQPTAAAGGPLPLNIGNLFTVGSSNLNVTEFGAYIAPSQITSGLSTETYETNLYLVSGNPAFSASYGTPISVVIPIGTAVDSQGFAYVAQATTLTAGAQYALTDVGVLAASTNTADGNSLWGYNSSGGSAGTWSSVTLNQNVLSVVSNPANAAPTSNNGSYQEFMGGNLQYSVPEPATLGLLGLGGLGMLLAKRRKTA